MVRKHQELPASLARLQRRLEAWRKQRNRGDRIPEPLWNAATAQAARFGVSRTATALKLGYYSLKERVDRQSSTDKQAFVEVLPTAIPTLPISTDSIGPQSCVIECEDARGTRMRVQLQACQPADVLAWGRAFFEGRG